MKNSHLQGWTQQYNYSAGTVKVDYLEIVTHWSAVLDNMMKVVHHLPKQSWSDPSVREKTGNYLENVIEVYFRWFVWFYSQERSMFVLSKGQAYQGSRCRQKCWRGNNTTGASAPHPQTRKALGDTHLHQAGPFPTPTHPCSNIS